ncbi:WecB/TagA/CpsF family glycosyltransferase [Pseudomonas putida]|uniref:Glycosyltransferase n=1 Tax=Pseudomonas putida TaxID=303 RepID=A0A1X1A2R8_PSEPU|nr:WecB/TagA/CpsF family glycosyltransferase [Pseudomonas putida]ORL66216.1 hypothetical protein B7H17_05540 [Pseudomonas putida]
MINKIEANSSELFRNKEGLVTFLNPYSYVVARNNKEVYSEFDHIYADGVLLSMATTFLLRRTERISFDFTSIACDVFEYACRSGQDIYIVGSTAENVAKAVEVFRQRYPKLIISGARDGFFNDLSRREFVREIVEVQPKIIIVGMGAPLQEQLLIDLKKAGWKGWGFTCGGFLHQTAKFEGDYYPVLINKLNLRWLYRMYDEPKLIKRYFFYYPLFAVCFLCDWASHQRKRLFNNL